nr:L,D-transpeptidase [Falsirhodobacter algicola]
MTRAPVNPDYAAVQDGDFMIPAVNPAFLTPEKVRQEVDYTGPEEANTIVVDPFARRLYYVLPNGRAMRYAVGVGPEGKAFRGNARIGRKAEWPRWTPTQNMIRTQPELYAEYAAGLPGGLENPLGARALYLYRYGRDTYYRIHGTIDNRSIGRASSAGCIRLFNQDIMDLYERVDVGTRVKVRTEAESRAYEGEWVEDANGDIHPPGWTAPVQMASAG